jgi:hypothetical protein
MKTETKSVSRVEEEEREKTHESNRQKNSSAKAVKSQPSNHFTRQKQHQSVTASSPVGPNDKPTVQPSRPVQPSEAKSVDYRRKETEENFRKLRKTTSDNK